MKDGDARRAILNRRARFVAAALASAGLVAGAQSCGGQTEREGNKSDAGEDTSLPQPCLAAETGPQPCLGMPQEDASPQPCLDVPIDASTD